MSLGGCGTSTTLTKSLYPDDYHKYRRSTMESFGTPGSLPAVACESEGYIRDFSDGSTEPEQLCLSDSQPYLLFCTYWPHASKVLFLAPSVTFHFLFVCVSDISVTAKRICTTFTVKMCLVPRSDELECQGQRSRSPGTKKRKTAESSHWQCIVSRGDGGGLCLVKHL